MKRARRTGHFYPHLHLAFWGRTGSPYRGMGGGDWIFTPEELEEYWESLLKDYAEFPADTTWGASCNLQAVRKDAGRYLSKYLSKALLEDESKQAESTGQTLPSAYHHISRELSGEIKKKTRHETLSSFAPILLQELVYEVGLSGWCRTFCLPGSSRPLCCYGYVEPEGINDLMTLAREAMGVPDF